MTRATFLLTFACLGLIGLLIFFVQLNQPDTTLDGSEPDVIASSNVLEDEEGIAPTIKFESPVNEDQPIVQDVVEGASSEIKATVDIDSTQQPEPSHGFAIEGRVVDQFDTPVVGARVSIVAATMMHGMYMSLEMADGMGMMGGMGMGYGGMGMGMMGGESGPTPTPLPDSLKNNTVSNASGFFGIDGLEKFERFILTIQKDGFETYQQDIPLDGQFLNITLHQKPSIEGVVLHAGTEQPVPDAEVVLNTKMNMDFVSPAHSVQPHTVQTEQNGTFAFNDVPNQTFWLNITKTEFVDKRSEDINVENYQPDKDFYVIKIEPGQVFSGKVVNVTGDAIPNAVIAAQGIYYSHAGLAAAIPRDSVKTYTSDAQGEFTIATLPKEGDSLFVQHPEYADQIFEVAPEMLNAATETIVLKDGGTLEGFVRYKEKENPFGRDMVLQSIPDGYILHQEIKTDEEGFFQVKHLAAGNYSINYMSSNENGLFSDNKNIKIEDDKTTRVDFGGQGSISGTVYGDDKPIPNAIIGARFGLSGIRTTADEHGQYKFNNVTLGTYKLTLIENEDDTPPDSIKFMGSKTITITEEKDYQVDLHSNHYLVKGKVINSQTREPIPEVQIAKAHNQYSMPDMPSVTSDEKGEFVIQLPSPGDYSLMVEYKGFKSAYQTITIKENDEGGTYYIQFDLEPEEATLIVELIHKNSPLLESNFRNIMFWNNYLAGYSQVEPVEGKGNVYLTKSIPNGTYDLEIWTSGDKTYIGIVPGVTIEAGNPKTVSFDMIEVERFILSFTNISWQDLPRRMHIDLPNYPNFKHSPIDLRTVNIHNMILFPIDSQQATITVEGYQPVTVDLTQAVPGLDMNKNLVVPLVKE